MKKIVVFVSVVTFLGLVQSVQATSGACSYHGGVNCNYGPDYDGSVMCNDGWAESGVSYMSSDECVNNISCTTAELNSLLEKYDVVNLRAQYDSINIQIEQIKLDLQAALIVEENKPITMNSIIGAQNKLIDDANKKISSLSFQVQIIGADLNRKLESVKRECQVLGQDRIYKLVSLRYQQYLENERQRKSLQEQALAQEARQLELLRQEQARKATIQVIPEPSKVEVVIPIATPAPRIEAPKLVELPANKVESPESTPVKVASKTASSTLTTSSLQSLQPTTQIVDQAKQGVASKIWHYIKSFFSWRKDR